MHLLTWHGTLVCLLQGGGIRHHALPLPPGAPPALDFDTDAMFAEGPPRPHPLLGAIVLSPVASSGALSVRRYGRYLRAPADDAAMEFDCPAVHQWECFMPISARDVAVLEHVLRNRWIMRDSRVVVPRAQVRLGEGFLLHVCDSTIDLEAGLARILPDNAPAEEDTEPKTLALPGTGADSMALVIAEPRSSALLRTAVWPVRARRQAEMMVLSAHRAVLRREPDQAAFEGDAAFLLENQGAASLQDILDRLIEERSAADRIAASATSGPSDMAATDAVWHAQVQALIEQAEPARAIEILDAIVIRDPHDTRAWMSLANLRHQLGAYAAACSALESCLATEPDHVGAMIGLGARAADLGRPTAAVAFYKAALARAPHRLDARASLARAYNEMGWRDVAAAELERFGNPLTGWLLKVSRDTARALGHNRGVVAGMQARGMAELTMQDRINLAQSSFLTGDLECCREALDAGFALEPDRFALHVLRERLMAREQGVAAALEYMRSLHLRYARYPVYQVRIARLLHETGAYQGALDILEATPPEARGAEIFRLRGLLALALDQPAALSRVTAEWMAVDDRTTAPTIFAIAQARRAGHLRSLSDTVAPDAAASPDIVQFWHDPDVPADVARTMASWPQRNPGCRHVVFDAATARAFMADHCSPDILAGYDAAHHPAMQSDLFRLAYLTRHGGVYIDADERCTRDMRRVFAALDTVSLVAWQSPELPPYVYNGFLAARPGCPVIVDALQDAARLLAEHREKAIRSDMWQVTGPGVITRAIGRHVADPDSEGSVLLLSDIEYRAFAVTEEQLAYKQTSEGNWRVS